jgi:hypothetical protein
MKNSCKIVIASASIIAIASMVLAAGEPQGTFLPSEPQVVTGKIAYMERLGGFIIQGTDPVGEMMIVNPNPSVLKPLSDSGKLVRIKGLFTISADHFRIESIDGKRYQAAAKAP